MRRAIMSVVGSALLVAIMCFAPAASASTQLEYVALGDSYSAGSGTRLYYDPDDGCHRSPAAYPVLLAATLDMRLVFAACGGATIESAGATQLSRLSSNTRLVTLTVGGNDTAFSHVITQCSKPWPYTCWGDIDSASRFVRDVLPDRLAALYVEIRRAAPNATIIAVSYPRIFNGVDCQQVTRISVGEQHALNDVANFLAEVTESASRRAGISYVDARPGFVGHAICTDGEWVNGISNPTGESFHPNQVGHQGFAEIIRPLMVQAPSVSFPYNCFGFTGWFKLGSHVEQADWDGDGLPNECFGIAPDRRIYHAWPGHRWVEMPNGGRADDVDSSYVESTASRRRGVRVVVSDVGRYCSTLDSKWSPWSLCSTPPAG
jgi:lysophospholipase L1-like esterase